MRGSPEQESTLTLLTKQHMPNCNTVCGLSRVYSGETIGGLLALFATLMRPCGRAQAGGSLLPLLIASLLVRGTTC